MEKKNFSFKQAGSFISKDFLLEAMPFLGFLILLLFFTITTSGDFLSLKNITLIIKQSAILIVGAMGTIFVMAHGNIDFSLGGELALCALGGWFASQIHPALLLPACILVGVFCSYLVGLIHIKFNVQVFSAGMCVMFIGKGIVQTVTSMTMPIPSVYSKWDTFSLYFAFIIGAIVIAYILMEYTKVGKYNKAIGVNIKAAFFSGVPVGRYKTLAFIITGFMVGISAFLTLIRSGGVFSQTGATFEIDVLMVMVLGGMPLSGGQGTKIRNGVMGALTYYMLNNGLVLLGVSAEIIYMIKGLLFLLIVSFSYDRKND